MQLLTPSVPWTSSVSPRVFVKNGQGWAMLFSGIFHFLRIPWTSWLHPSALLCLLVDGSTLCGTVQAGASFNVADEVKQVGNWGSSKCCGWQLKLCWLLCKKEKLISAINRVIPKMYYSLSEDDIEILHRCIQLIFWECCFWWLWRQTGVQTRHRQSPCIPASFTIFGISRYNVWCGVHRWSIGVFPSVLCWWTQEFHVLLSYLLHGICYSAVKLHLQ